MSKDKKGPWVLRTRQEVIREVVMDNCTEQGAWDFTGDIVEETNLETISVTVLSVEPTE